MAGRPRALLAWSSGKDSAFALHVLRTQGEVEVAGLMTTVNMEFGRVAMHAVRAEVLDAQVEAVGLPLWTVPLPWPCSNDDYEAAMSAVCRRAVAAGIEVIAFGDLFLEEIRAYRERMLAETGLRPLFPLWGRDTADLAREMIAAGQRAVLVCVDPSQLDGGFAGRAFDAQLLGDLPSGVDPCGENGEFHTFAFDGPAFGTPVRHRLGEIVRRDGFVFADVVLDVERAGSVALT